MKPIRALIFSVTFLLPLAVYAADSAPGMANVIETGFSHDALNNGYANWDSLFVGGAHRFGERRTVYGELRETRRFDLQDREISGGYYHPLGDTWTGQFGASLGLDHRVLAKNSVFGQLQKTLDDGWNVQAEWRRSQYNTTSSDLLALTAERYWGNFRGAYKLYLGKPQGIGAASSHTGQLSYYYADRSFTTFGLARGRQVESLGPGLGVLTTQVSSSSLSGRHWLDERWGASYEVLVEHQGNLYLRKGIRLGLLYAL